MNSKNQFEVSAADAADTCDVSAPEQSKDKAYEKVVLYVKERIRNGEIKVGDKLPTERELSEKLELSRNSVREARAQWIIWDLFHAARAQETISQETSRE